MPREPYVFNKTDKAVLDILRDGQPHTIEEIFKAYDDPLYSDYAIRNHLSKLRKVIPPNQAIFFDRRGKGYRWVRILTVDD